MRVGFALPILGKMGTTENLIKVAQRAEALDYSSLWSAERLLAPLHPQTPYPGTPDGSHPESFRRALDPLDTLSFVAAHTKKASLGTSVINIPYYNPVMLARRLSTLDMLSNGRLRVGLGLGWSKDEMDAVGADKKNRGALADEFIQVLKAIWMTDPVEFQGKFFTVPKSYIGIKPVQKPHPPIYMAAYAPAAMKRMAEMTDGWNPAGVGLEGMKQMFSSAQQMAQHAGRAPASLKLIVRANLQIKDRPLGDDRRIFGGTLEQIKDDCAGCRAMGVDELFFDLSFDTAVQSIAQWLPLMEQLRKLA